MKIIPIILSLLFLGMALMPCTDAHICDETAESHEKGHSEEHKDDCTPLCLCSCCGISYTLPQPEECGIYCPKIESELTFSYNDQYHYSFHNVIWHPPIQS